MKQSSLTKLRSPATTACVVLLGLSAGLSVHAGFPSMVLEDGPVAYFRLGENVLAPPVSYATNLGSAGVSAQGTYAGLEAPMKQAAGALAGDAAARFDGSSRYVLIPTAAPVNLSPPFSVEAWVKPDSIRASGSLACPVGSLYRSGSNAKGWIFYQDADGWNYRQGNSAGYTINIKGGGAPDTNTWYHLVATFDGTTASLYVNGALVKTGSNTAYEPNTDVPMGIGARGDASFQFPGTVDEVAIYPTALAAGDVSAHYNAATGNPAGYKNLVMGLNPAGYWRLNEPVYVFPKAANLGTLGAAADGGYHGGVTSATGPQLPGFPGMDTGNMGASFDGTNGFVRIPELGNLTDSSLKAVTEATFLCWVKRNGAQGGYKGLFGMRPLSNGLYLNTDDTLNYSWNDAGNTWGFNSGLVPPDGEWALAAVVVRADQATFYLQSVSGGFSSAVNSVSHAAADFTSGPFAIGVDIPNPARYFNGAIDEAALFTKALGEGRIRTYFLAATGASGVVPAMATDPPTLNPAGTIYTTTTFSVNSDAYGTPPLGYQWRLNGNPITGATNSSYVKANAVAGDAGGYDVIVSNNAGSITSSVVQVTINAAVPPNIDQPPVTATRYAGSTVSFQVAVSGTLPLQYQWKFNGASILNATNATLVLTNVTAANQGSYSVAVTNVAGYAISGSASLTLKTPPAGSYEEAVVALGPVAYWRFNEAAGSGMVPDYAGGYDATLVGSVVNGVAGPRPPTFPGLEPGNTASELNGADAGATSGASLVSHLPHFTILGWFRPTGAQPASGGRVALFGQNDCAEFGYHGLTAIGLWTPNGGFITFDSSRVKVGEWYFITATADGTAMNIYLNGLLAATGGSPTTDYGSSAYPFNMGYAVLDGSGNNFLGDIDEVAFFNRALSPAEILALNSKATGIKFKVDLAASQDVVKDTKPQGTLHDGFNNGAFWLTSSTDSAGKTRQGLMQFNPTNGPTQVQIPWNGDFNSSEGTMTFWMRTAGNTDTNGNDAAMLVDRRGSNGDVIVLQDDGTLFWQPSWIYGQSSFATVNDDKWHHVAYVYNQINTVSLYIDGALDSQHTDATVWSWDPRPIELGLSHDAYWRAYDGLLDDFRVYSRQLTDQEIANIYAGDAAALVGAADLVGRYNFDNPPGGLRLTLTWPLGTLQSADSLTGPWSNVPGATSPYYVTSPKGMKFFRLKL